MFPKKCLTFGLTSKIPSILALVRFCRGAIRVGLTRCPRRKFLSAFSKMIFYFLSDGSNSKSFL